jgi:hypothetical protein
VHANHWHFFRNFLDGAHPAYTPEEIDRYVEAWSQPGAATGMINHYRASVRQSPKHAEAALRPISAPTLVIWGQRDRYLGEELAEPDHDDVPNLDRVERLPDASSTGSITTGLNASTNCSSTSSPPPANRAPLNVDEVPTRPGWSVPDSPAGRTCPSHTRPALRAYGCAPIPSTRGTNGLRGSSLP